MKLHRPWRAGCQTDTADQALFVVKINTPGFLIKLESISGANNDTRTAVSASLFISNNILAQGLYSQTCLGQIVDSLIKVILLPFSLNNHKPPLSGGN